MKRYTSTTKWVLILINLLSVILLGCCVIVGAAIYNLADGDWNSMMKGGSYIESPVLEKALVRQGRYLERYFNECDFFETDGVYDSELPVDIFQYMETMKGIEAIQPPLYYKLGDLVAAYSVLNNSMTSDLNGIIYKESVRDLATLKSSTGLSETDISERIEKVNLLVKPIYFENIQEYAQKNNIAEFECFIDLIYVINSLQDDLYDYQTSKTVYSNKNTNVQYVATNKESGKRYSNISSYKFDSEKKGITKTEKGDYTILLTLDENYPIQDTFYKSAISYDKYMPYFKSVLWSGLIGLMGCLITYIMLGALLMNSDKGLSIIWVDRIKTEIALASWLGVAIVACYFTAYNAKLYCEEFDFVRLVFSGVGIAIIGLTMVSTFLSMTRRIKNQTMLTNSLYINVRGILSETLGHTKIPIRLIIFFMGYNLVNLICSWWLEFGVAAIVIFNIIVGLFILKYGVARQRIQDGVQIIAQGELDYKIDEKGITGSNLELARSINRMGEGLSDAVQSDMKNERLKADLITNVSHDIKTPLTSIINYVDLLKREKIISEKAQNYIRILDNKSQRLKQLTEDLVEASKISSGNVKLELLNLDFNELILQTIGEFEEKFQDRNLELVVKHPDDPVIIKADGRCVWRIVENLFNNVIKYALPGTRVYVDLMTIEHKMFLSVKNISECPLNINASELTERFIRGDVSRSTEGSGLGLSIAQNLTLLQKGGFDIYLDGDLFKVTVRFDLSKEY